MSDKPAIPKEDAFILEQTRIHSKAYALQLFDLIVRHTPDDKHGVKPGQLATPKKSAGFPIRLLKTIPWLLAGLFLFSFYWDFAGKVFQVASFTFALDGFLRMISVSGLIGYLTNWIAITMLFRPVYKRPLLRQGLIPAQKIRIAEKLADSVSTELINAEVIRRKLQDQKLISIYRERFVNTTRNVVQNPAFQSELKHLLVNYVDELLGNPAVREIIAKKTFEYMEKSVEDKSIEKLAFITYKLLRGEEAQKIIERAIADLPEKLRANLDQIENVLDKIPAAVEENAELLENWAVSAIVGMVHSLDIRTIVVDNLYQYDEQRFERMIKSSTNEQLQYIQYLGAILGAVGGLVIWQPVPALIFLSTLISAVFAADALIYRLQARIRS